MSGMPLKRMAVRLEEWPFSRVLILWRDPETRPLYIRHDLRVTRANTQVHVCYPGNSKYRSLVVIMRSTFQEMRDYSYRNDDSN